MEDTLNKMMDKFKRGNTNAFEELNRFFETPNLTYKDIICAEIKVWEVYEEDRNFEYEFYLSKNHTQSDLDIFLSQLKEINYNSGYGGQNLFGCIWLTNNRWMERGEYDGSEWWILQEYPSIPEHLN